MATPESPPPSVLELRVHGVGGASPSDMLGVAPDAVEQVAGNSLTGFYRVKEGKVPGREVAGTQIVVEAYSWGRLTSGLSGILGGIRRALWLCLAPFAFANLAYWARIHIDDSAKSRAMVALARLGALGLTVFMVLIPAFIGVDLIAWQCYGGGSPGCTRLPGLFDFIAGLTATQRSVVGSAVPLAFVVLLWFLSKKSLMRYEAVDSLPSDGGKSVLRHKNLWNGLERTKQLQRVHLTVALVVVTAFPMVHARHKWENPTWVDVLFSVTVALAVLAGLWSVLVHPDDVDHGASPTFSDKLGRVYDVAPRWLPAAALVALAANFAVLWTLNYQPRAGEAFFGHNLWFIAVFVVLTAIYLAMFTVERFDWFLTVATVLAFLGLATGALVLHINLGAGKDVSAGARLLGLATVGLVILLAVLAASIRGRNAVRAWRGAAPAVLLATAAWVALLFNTGVVFAAANYLNGDQHSAGDLVSVLDVDTIEEALDDEGKGRYTATGDVVIRGAFVTGSGKEGLTVHSGSIMAERVFHDEKVDGQLLMLQKGRSAIDHGRVVVEAKRVLLQDSCRLKPDGHQCTPEHDGFVVGADVALDSPLIVPKGNGDVSIVPAIPPEIPLVVPQVLIWAPMLVGVWLVAVAIWALAALRRMKSTHAAIAEGAVTDGIDEHDRTDAVAVRKAAAFAHRAEALLDVVGWFTGLLGLALIGLSSTGLAPWVVNPQLRPLATVGLYLAVGLGLGLIALAAKLRKSEGMSRVVGIVWDITTFWPRAAHPFAPPCYAERVVPEVERRVKWALALPERPTVILSGHSQGSAIVAAVASRLSDDELSRVKIVTYGSQIRGLYGRIFPAVFGHKQIGYEPTEGMATFTDVTADLPSATTSDAVPWTDKPASLAARLHGAGGEWVNLFRRTDPIGWRVFSDSDSTRDRFVAEVTPRSRGNSGPAVANHSNFQFSPEYRRLMSEWTGERFVEDPDGVVGVLPFPS